MSHPITLSHGEIPNDWQELPNLPTVKTSVVLLPPQPSPPVGTVPHDKYERLKRYMGARIATGFEVQAILFQADEYARKLIGQQTPDDLDVVATIVEIAAVELGIHPCLKVGGGANAPSA